MQYPQGTKQKTDDIAAALEGVEGNFLVTYEGRQFLGIAQGGHSLVSLRPLHSNGQWQFIRLTNTAEMGNEQQTQPTSRAGAR